MNPSDGKASDAKPLVRSAVDAHALGMGYQIEVLPDGQRRFAFVGQRCLAVNGVTAEAAMADPSRLYRLILPEHRAAFAAAEEEAIARQQPFDIEVALRRADGEVRWHRFASLPRTQPDGRVLWDGLQIDITEQRAIAQALEEQRQRLEVALDATDLGLWEMDLRSDRLDWSERNRELFGVAAGEVVTRRGFLALVHPEDRDRVLEAYRPARDAGAGGNFSVEYRIVTPAGEPRWMLTRGRVLTDPQGPRTVIGTTLDVTERRNAEERRKLLVGELAHRAKNGIAVIMAIVAQTARGQETVQGFEDLVMARLQAMAASIDLVTAAGGGPVDLVEVMTKTLSTFGLGRFDIDDALQGVTVRADIGAGMGLLLHEMATNATKYGALSNATGRIAITVAAAEAGAAFDWREHGGPEVRLSNRQGFGTRVLQLGLRANGGQVSFEFKPSGFCARVEFPTT